MIAKCLKNQLQSKIKMLACFIVVLSNKNGYELIGRQLPSGFGLACSGSVFRRDPGQSSWVVPMHALINNGRKV